MQTVMQNKPLQKNCNPASQQNQQTGSFRKSKPKANIFTKNDGWEISLSLPGFTKEDVSISLDRYVLKISGTQEAKKEEYNRKEWSLESFDRSFRLPGRRKYGGNICGNEKRDSDCFYAQNRKKGF
ncbi:MAG: Hsp20/alpha crystallin family protein [Saprospiraceae bacterium]|nr:Hsp20/alpha crystallin family protein [Saprospiraceae bacterium]